MEVLDGKGQTVRLKERLGKPVVIYFYPKDDTPGCTKESCSIRDVKEEFDMLGVSVIGVSKDSSTLHQKFIAKYKLPFELWSDSEHKLMEAFGVWQKKKFMGREYMGTARSTFFLDQEGIIRKVWEKATPEQHGEEILDFSRMFMGDFVHNKK